jgi:hypothetical protein
MASAILVKFGRGDRQELSVRSLPSEKVDLLKQGSHQASGGLRAANRLGNIFDTASYLRVNGAAG